jgi:metal-sulfur cluster biosynthetic enzyme
MHDDRMIDDAVDDALPAVDDATAATIEREALRVLDEIKDPCSIATSVPMGLVEMGIVKAVRVDECGDVQVELRLTSPVCEMVGYMKTEALARVGSLTGVRSVSVRHDSGLDWSPDLIAPAARERRNSRLLTLRAVHELHWIDRPGSPAR